MPIDERTEPAGTGVTRRDVLRRGAIVAGTLAWTVPAIQSVTPTAYAAAESGACASCYCYRNDAHGHIKSDLCTTGAPLGVLASTDACLAYCLATRAPGMGNKKFTHATYCQGTTCVCSSKVAGNPYPFGPTCT